jgi:Bacterial SH3 domain
VNRLTPPTPNIAAPAPLFRSATRKQPPGGLSGRFHAAFKRLISVLVGVVLVPIAILLVQLWHTTMMGQWENKDAASTLVPAQMSSATRREQSAQRQSATEIVLSSPDRIEVKAGNAINFHLAIDATDALPPRSIIAVNGLPDGAAFSEGRPYGTTGWSLRPDEIGDLRLRLPSGPSGASNLRIELVAADGTVLAQSETRLTIATELAEEMTWMTLAGHPFDKLALSEFVEPIPAMPQRKPTRSDPSVKVRTVKVMTIKPPKPRLPHDGAYALGVAKEAPTEWVEIVSAVDMHARAQQFSETVRVVEKGFKMRVTGRDKGWVQVSDPATSSKGWIYSRFLKPTEPPQH